MQDVVMLIINYIGHRAAGRLERRSLGPFMAPLNFQASLIDLASGYEDGPPRVASLPAHKRPAMPCLLLSLDQFVKDLSQDVPAPV